MKIQPQSTDDLTHLGKTLSSHRVAMLTFLEGPAGLSSRPMTPLEMDAQGAIWFIASRKAIAEHIGAGGKPVNLAFMGDADYISVAGQAELVDSAERKTELWTLFARPWFKGADDPDLVLLKVRTGRADIWDGPDSAVSRAIGMAASVVAGREIGLGNKTVIAPTGR